MAKTRFGLIGYGLWGQHHANAIQNSPNAELVAICARSEETRNAAQKAFPDVQLESDYNTLVNRDDIDAVDVVVPSDLHFDIGSAALNANKHVMMEKPMTLDVKSSRALHELAKEKNRLLSIGFELRLSDLWGRVHSMISAGKIGRPQYCLIELWRRPYRPGSEGWRFDINRVGNWVLEEPIHFFDLARWYLSALGEPTSILAFANSRQPDHPELQDNFSAVLRFPSGSYAVITQTLSAFQHHQTAKITGTEGALWASWSGAKDRDLHPTASLQYCTADSETAELIPLEKPTGELFELAEEVDAFARVVGGEGSLWADSIDGIWSVALCEAAQESIRTNSEIAITNPLV